MCKANRLVMRKAYKEHVSMQLHKMPLLRVSQAEAEAESRAFKGVEGHDISF